MDLDDRPVKADVVGVTGLILNGVNQSNFQGSHIWKQLSTFCATYEIFGTKQSLTHEDFTLLTNCGVGLMSIGLIPVGLTQATF